MLKFQTNRTTMKIEIRVIHIIRRHSHDLTRARKRKKWRKNRGGVGTSRSGRSVLIKRTQGPRTLNTFGPDDVFQRGRMVDCEGRGKRRGRKSAESGVYKIVSRA